MGNLAPVIVFAYNRPLHTRQCLDALAQNKLARESDLIIYSDGPKANLKKEELTKIEAVRDIIAKENRFKQVKIIESAVNKGLSRSVIEGVTEVINQYGKAIILEDDLIASKGFLKFMNDALNEYENNDAVACITGYIYPVKETLPELFFLKGADCWGWATWKRSWACFKEDGQVLLNELMNRQLMHDFDFSSTYPYTDMLRDQINGKNNSWAIRWYASAYLENKLTLYPGRSLIKNTGFDGTGVHSGKKGFEQDFQMDAYVSIKPIEVKENEEAKSIIAGYFKKLYTGNYMLRVKKAVQRLLSNK